MSERKEMKSTANGFAQKSMLKFVIIQKQQRIK